MKKYMLALGLSLLTVLGLFTGCSPKAETASDSDSLKIVATIFPEYDWVRQVLGDRAGEVQLTLLLDSGTDLHSYQPTAADMLTIGSVTCSSTTAGNRMPGWNGCLPPPPIPAAAPSV